MAIMVNCATDWSFDLFVEAMESVKALPLPRGVRPSANLSEAQVFATYVKTALKFANINTKTYYTDDIDEEVRDVLCDMGFSDWYKDVFNQRPHFESYLVGALCGIHGTCWSIETWSCKNPIENRKELARSNREKMEAWYRENTRV